MGSCGVSGGFEGFLGGLRGSFEEGLRGVLGGFEGFLKGLRASLRPFEGSPMRAPLLPIGSAASERHYFVGTPGSGTLLN